MLAELQLNYDKLVVHCVCCRSLRTLERFMLCAVSRERLKTGSSCWKQKFLSMSETYIVCNKCRICLCMLMAVLLFLCTCLDGHIGTAAVEWASVNIVHSVIWIVFIVLFVKFGLNGYRHNILFSFNNLPDLMYLPPEPQNLSQNGLV